MALNLERFKEDLKKLIERGNTLLFSIIKEAHGTDYLRKVYEDQSDEKFKEEMKLIPSFRDAYEGWYSESIAVIKQVLPDRLQDFKRQYEKSKTRKSINHETYVIEDFMLDIEIKSAGRIVVDKKAAIVKLQNQQAILGAANARFISSLFEIRQLVQADLFDDEILSARELHKNKFYRAAGAVSGVVLEKHLAQVCLDRGIPIKKNPTIGDLNDALKGAGTIDIPQWRFVSHLADIRNICDHNKAKEPTPDQVSDLINGTDKALKTIA